MKRVLGRMAGAQGRVKRMLGRMAGACGRVRRVLGRMDLQGEEGAR